MRMKRQHGTSAVAVARPKSVERDGDTILLHAELYKLAVTEALAVILWILSSCLFRLSLSSLSGLAAIRNDNDDRGASNNMTDSFVKEILTTISILAGWVLSLLPNKAVSAQDAAPGFVFASAWLLLPIHDMVGTIPNMSTRICETIIGRIALRELAVIIPVHFIGTIFGASVVQYLLPISLEKYAQFSVVYSGTNPWIVDFFRETAANAVFVLSILVVPELLKLNKISRFVTGILLYPLYCFSVDSTGTGSMFGPNTILAFQILNKSKQQQNALQMRWWSHILGPMLGGIVGGKIMCNFFPDDPIAIG